MKSAVVNILKGWKIKTSFLVLFFLMLFSSFYTFYLNCQINEKYKQLQQVNGEIYNLKKELIKENNIQSKGILNKRPAAIHLANATGFSYDLTYITAASKNFHQFKIFEPQIIISIISLSTLSKIAIDTLKKRIVKMPVTVFVFIKPEKYNID